MADKRDPRVSVGLDHHATGAIDYVDFAQPFGPQRKIEIDGSHYEHFANDSDGVWLYRREAF